MMGTIKGEVQIGIKDASIRENPSLALGHTTLWLYFMCRV